MDKLLVTHDGPVTTFTINRPQARNAVDAETLKLLWDAFAAFDSDENSSVAVVTGAGGSFCAGADLKELSQGVGIGFSWAGEERGITRKRLGKPVIAAVEGHAVAAGLALAVWCDMRVIDDTAVFGVFCRRFGVPMVNGSSVRLPRLIGEGRALDMFLTGRPVDAKEAFAVGLADRLVARGTALAAAQALAADIAAFPQVCLRSDRASMIGQWGMPEDEAIAREVELGRSAFRAESRTGAAEFVAGQGRHGRFG